MPNNNVLNSIFSGAPGGGTNQLQGIPDLIPYTINPSSWAAQNYLDPSWYYNTNISPSPTERERVVKISPLAYATIVDFGTENIKTHKDNLLAIINEKLRLYTNQSMPNTTDSIAWLNREENIAAEAIRISEPILEAIHKEEKYKYNELFFLYIINKTKNKYDVNKGKYKFYPRLRKKVQKDNGNILEEILKACQPSIERIRCK